MLFYFVLFSTPSPSLILLSSPYNSLGISHPECAGISFYRRIAFLGRDISKSWDLRTSRSDYGKCSRCGSGQEIRTNSPKRPLVSERRHRPIFISRFYFLMQREVSTQFHCFSIARMLPARHSLSTGTNVRVNSSFEESYDPISTEL